MTGVYFPEILLCKLLYQIVLKSKNSLKIPIYKGFPLARFLRSAGLVDKNTHKILFFLMLLNCDRIS